MSNSYNIAPYITEKSNAEMANGKYYFVVGTNLTKVDIRNAVESLLDVRVLSVRTLNYYGKKKRQGVHVGRRPKRKIAIVKIDQDPPKNAKRKYRTEIQEFGATQ